MPSAVGARIGTLLTFQTFTGGEPGLARVLDGFSTAGGVATAAGWVDLEPVQQLRNLDCQKVIYVTRRGDTDSPFAMGVAGLLGMSESERESIYELKNPNSSFVRALREADGVWCTNWDSFNPKDIATIEADGYGAPLETWGSHGHPGCDGALTSQE